MKKHFLVALCLIVIFPYIAMAGVPGNGLRMGEYYCPKFNADCDKLYGIANDAIEAANECIGDRLGISKPIMTSFSSSGANENCVLPSETFVDDSGTTTWAICCVRRIESERTCGLFCTRYATPR